MWDHERERRSGHSNAGKSLLHISAQGGVERKLGLRSAISTNDIYRPESAFAEDEHRGGIPPPLGTI